MKKDKKDRNGSAEEKSKKDRSKSDARSDSTKNGSQARRMTEKDQNEDRSVNSGR